MDTCRNETGLKMGKQKGNPAKIFRPSFSESPEFYITKMATAVASFVWATPEYCLRKFPYIQALTLLMLLAERALKMEKYPPMHPYIIYTVAGVCAIAGILMSFKMKLKYASLLYCIVLVYLALNAYTNKKFNFSKHVRNRISSRHLGCFGIYCIYAFIKSSRQSKLLHRIGELSIAVYLITQAYLVNESYEDKKAITDLVPGGNYARYFITLIYGSSGLCFLSGYFLKDISMTMVFCLTFLTGVVDMRFWFWTYKGMTYWNQMRLVVDNVNLILGFFVLMSHYENLTEEEREEIQRAEEEVDDKED